MATVLENKKILTPFVVGPEECRLAHPMQMPGHEVLVKACSEDTGGVFAVGLLLAKPMSGPPLHMHTREDEWFYIRSGEFTFQVANERFTAGPGTSVFAPRDIPHTWQNCTDEVAEALVMITPADIEGFFLEAARDPTNQEKFQSLMAEYGIVMLGPPLERES